MSTKKGTQTTKGRASSKGQTTNQQTAQGSAAQTDLAKPRTAERARGLTDDGLTAFLADLLEGVGGPACVKVHRPELYDFEDEHLGRLVSQVFEGLNVETRHAVALLTLLHAMAATDDQDTRDRAILAARRQLVPDIAETDNLVAAMVMRHARALK